MNIIDIAIVLLILVMGVIGLKRGFFKQLVMSVGIILIVLISLALKNPLANFLSLKLPFFSFSNIPGISSILNILFYQVISFIIIFGLLTILFNVVLWVTNIFEKLLKITIILAIPSKILGFILGIIEGYILVFAFSFLLTQPALNIDVVQESKLLSAIQNSTPGLSGMMNKTYDAIKDIYDLKEVYDKDNEKSYDEFSYKSLEIMLENKVVKADYIEKLEQADKLHIKNVNRLIKKYK